MMPKMGRCQCNRVSDALPACMREATGRDGMCDVCRSSEACQGYRRQLVRAAQSFFAARVEDRLREWKEMRRGGG